MVLQFEVPVVLMFLPVLRIFVLQRRLVLMQLQLVVVVRMMRRRWAVAIGELLLGLGRVSVSLQMLVLARLLLAVRIVRFVVVDANLLLVVVIVVRVPVSM